MKGDFTKWDEIQLKMIAFLYLVLWCWDIESYVKICSSIEYLKNLEGDFRE